MRRSEQLQITERQIELVQSRDPALAQRSPGDHRTLSGDGNARGCTASRSDDQRVVSDPAQATESRTLAVDLTHGQLTGGAAAPDAVHGPTCGVSCPAIAERLERVAPRTEVGGAISVESLVAPGDRRRQGTDRITVPGRVRRWPQVCRRSGAGDARERSQREGSDAHRRSSELDPPHLQVAGQALVVRRVEDRIDSGGGELLDRRHAEFAEDATTLEIGIGGGVDRADHLQGLARGSVHEAPAQERAEASEPSPRFGDPGRRSSEGVLLVLPTEEVPVALIAVPAQALHPERDDPVEVLVGRRPDGDSVGTGDAP